MSGSGRGRAWLRLGQNTIPTRPGIEPNPNDSSVSTTETEEKINSIAISYNDLIDKFQIFSVDDDGIATNNKIYHIRSEFMIKCPNINLISEAVEAIHEQCLVNEDLAQKFIIFITSAHFENKQKSKEQLLWRDTVRKTFISLLQKDFEAAELNREKFPVKFFNAIKLCSDYFHKLNKFPVVEKISTVGYLWILLKYNTSKDISMIIHLICHHSSVILDLSRGEMFSLFDKLKHKLIFAPLSESQRMYIFLIYELLVQKYQLTEDQLDFYKSNMNAADFSEVLTWLSVLPQSILNMNDSGNWRKFEEQNNHTSEGNPTKKIFPQQCTMQNYKSCDDNVSEETDVSVERSREQFTHKANDSDNRWRKECSEDGMWRESKDGAWGEEPCKDENWRHEPSNTQWKVGRPILGVGARLKKM